MNSHAARRDCHGLSVKAASVIGDCYLNIRSRTGELDTDGFGSRMPRYVGQGFLKNAVERDLKP
jgi:hypothetical protein